MTVLSNKYVNTVVATKIATAAIDSIKTKKTEKLSAMKPEVKIVAQSGKFNVTYGERKGSVTYKDGVVSISNADLTFKDLVVKDEIAKILPSVSSKGAAEKVETYANAMIQRAIDSLTNENLKRTPAKKHEDEALLG